MRHNAKIGCGALLLSLALTAPSLAQNTQTTQTAGTRTVTYGCSTGTVGGKCLSPAVWGAAFRAAQLNVFNASRTILPVPPTQEAGIVDPLLQSNKRQPQYGLNATGPIGASGGGGPNFIYGRW